MRRPLNFYLGIVFAVSPAAIAIPLKELLNQLPSTTYGTVLLGSAVLATTSSIWGLRCLIGFVMYGKDAYFKKLFAILASIVALFSVAAYVWTILVMAVQ